MGRMADALAWFRKAVAGAQIQNEREDLLDELDDITLARGDLHWELNVAENRARQIRARLRVLEGHEDRRAASVGEKPAFTEGKNVHELQARFANKHPELAEHFRLRRYGDFHTEYTAEVRRREKVEQVGK
jgi:hypothetical protein